MHVYEYSYTRRAIAEHAGRISVPADVVSVFHQYYAGLENERLVVLALNTKNEIIGMETLYIGNVAGSSVRVGEVFRFAVRHNATSIVIAHNHPSNDPTPSADDLRVTGDIVQAGKIMDIDVLDHIIMSDNRHISLRQLGALGI
jgi:DNA repair protein RadC